MRDARRRPNRRQGHKSDTGGTQDGVPGDVSGEAVKRQALAQRRRQPVGTRVPAQAQAMRSRSEPARQPLIASGRLTIEAERGGPAECGVAVSS
jgi:hypothetical protein